MALHVASGRDMPPRALSLYANPRASHAPRPDSPGNRKGRRAIQVWIVEGVPHGRHHERGDGVVREVLALHLGLLASWPAAGGSPRRGRTEPGSLGDPSLIVHHALREPAVAAAWATCPDIALNAQQVNTADDAPEAAIRKVGAPRVL